jgi:hypothetical protein
MTASLVLRRRNGWEAADSGLLLWRNNLPYFPLFFALPFLGVILTLVFIPVSVPAWIGGLLLWWLKPLFDRLILHVIAVRFFESGAPLRRLFRGLGKSLGRGLAGDLLWRRFSPLRSAVMPVRTLENPRGSKKRRIRALRRGCLNFGVLLSCLGLGIELALLGGEAGFSVIALQLDPGSSVRSFFEKYGFELIIFWAYGVNYMFAESLYVCMGFGLYVNSRVEVEGWDIQLLFQDFVKKRKAPGIVLALILGFFVPLRGFAETPVPAWALEEVLASPDFGGEEESWGIRLRGGDKRAELPRAGPFRAEEGKERVARGLRLFLAAAAAGLAGFFLFRLRGFVRKNNPGGKPGSPGIPAGESPETLLARARNRYARGELRAAWAACLAAALGACESRGWAFPREATEYECLALVRSREGGRESRIAGGFAFLVENWTALAYGGAAPRAGAFESALDFCQSLLGGPPRGGPAGDHA